MYFLIVLILWMEIHALYTDAGKGWRQKEKEGSKEWGGSIASLTQWTWVWAISRRYRRTGKPAMLQSMGPQRDMTRFSDWTTILLMAPHYPKEGPHSSLAWFKRKMKPLPSVRLEVRREWESHAKTDAIKKMSGKSYLIHTVFFKSRIYDLFVLCQHEWSNDYIK